MFLVKILPRSIDTSLEIDPDGQLFWVVAYLFWEHEYKMGKLQDFGGFLNLFK